MTLRKKSFYFKQLKDAPGPVVVETRRRVRFSEVDIMGVVWYGRYMSYFEEGSAEIGRLCNLSYKDFYGAKLMAPIVECHVDYHASLYLGEEFLIRTSLMWHEGARINIMYQLIKDEGILAVSGYTVQLLTDTHGNVCIVSPQLLEKCRQRWEKGEFHCRK